jgi:hypothetical protein
MQDSLPPGRPLSPAEFEHIRTIMFPHQKRGKNLTIALFCIIVAADLISLYFIIQGYRDIRFFILLGVGNILAVMAWFNIRSHTFLHVPEMHAIPIEGKYSIAKVHTKRGDVERYLIGEFPVILPGNWLESLKPGENIAGEVYPLVNGYAILLSVQSKGLRIQ